MTNKELISKIREEILHLKMKELQRTNGINTGADVYLSSYAVLSILSNALTEESEDERIRKKIIEHLEMIKMGCVICTIDTSEEIAWLEKQKYDRMKPIYDARESFESALEKAWNDYHNRYENVDKLEDDYVECAHAKGFREGYLFGIEKQKEQEPICDSAQFEEGFKTGLEIGLRKQKVQKPAEWSEKHIADVFEKVGLAKIAREQGNDALTNAVQSALIELSKAGNAEWSEEDEDMLNSCISSIEEAKENRYAYKETDGDTSYDHEIAWLKSLRPPQYCENCKLKKSVQGWKPSEEQMEAMEFVIKDYREDGCTATANYLQEILDQIKKL